MLTQLITCSSYESQKLSSKMMKCMFLAVRVLCSKPQVPGFKSQPGLDFLKHSQARSSLADFSMGKIVG